MKTATKTTPRANPNGDREIPGSTGRNCKFCGTVYWHGVICGCAASKPASQAVSVDSISLDVSFKGAILEF